MKGFVPEENERKNIAGNSNNEKNKVFDERIMMRIFPMNLSVQKETELEMVYNVFIQLKSYCA